MIVSTVAQDHQDEMIDSMADLGHRRRGGMTALTAGRGLRRGEIGIVTGIWTGEMTGAMIDGTIAVTTGKLLTLLYFHHEPRQC
jgi:hypothetical protein